MNYVYLVLSILTVIYLVLSAKRDLKERLIYSFPCVILMDAWAIVLWKGTSYSQVFIIAYLLGHALIFLLMKLKKLWGDGDGDMFLLLGNVCIACLQMENPISLVITECLCVVAVMIIAIGVGAIEYKVKKKPFHINGDVAVVPGFAVVVTAVIIAGVCRRFM